MARSYKEVIDMMTFEDIISGLPDASDICGDQYGMEFKHWLCRHSNEVRYILKWFPCTSEADFVDKFMSEGLNTLVGYADMEKRLAEEDDKA